MRRKLFQDISASAVQVIISQGLGLIIFLITSRYLAKDTFGEMNWSLAVLTFVTTILSLRLEQIVVKKVAAGENASELLTVFTGHVVFTGLFFYAGLFAFSLLFPSFFRSHDLLLLLAVSHLLGFFSSPFKQLANGREHFRILAVMSVLSNLIRAVWLLVAIALNDFSIEIVILVYIVSSLAELLACYFLARYILKVGFGTAFWWQSYKRLIRESLPMAGAVILHATIARMDWILLGLFTTSLQTAEYSFAYKVFEVSPLPLLIMAPILLSRFSRFFSKHSEDDLLQRKEELSLLIRGSMVVATLIPLVLNMVWAPLMDALTAGKYGAVNTTTFLLLSLCLPFLYMNNILWSVHLAQNRLRKILWVAGVSFMIILAGDLVLIPRYAAIGAASVYLGATVIEYVNYLRGSVLARLSETITAPFACLICAMAGGWAALALTEHLVLRLLVSVSIFCFLLLATKQLRKSDWINIRKARVSKD